MLGRTGPISDAIKAYEMAIEMNAEYLDAYNNKGIE